MNFMKGRSCSVPNAQNTEAQGCLEIVDCDIQKEVKKYLVPQPNLENGQSAAVRASAANRIKITLVRSCLVQA
jgi:hypothetical protein